MTSQIRGRLCAGIRFCLAAKSPFYMRSGDCVIIHELICGIHDFSAVTDIDADNDLSRVCGRPKLVISTRAVKIQKIDPATRHRVIV